MTSPRLLASLLAVLIAWPSARAQKPAADAGKAAGVFDDDKPAARAQDRARNSLARSRAEPDIASSLR